MSDKRRMFSATVIGSTEFLFMKTQSQALYFQLCINADDYGILNNARLIVRLAGVKQEHLDELTENGFVIELEKNLHAITHWFVSNQIRADRSRDSDYKAKINAKLIVDDDGVYHKKSDSCDDFSANNESSKYLDRENCNQNDTIPEIERSSKYLDREKSAKSAPKDSIDKDSIDKDSIAHTINTENVQKNCNFTKNVCANECVCGDSSNKSSDLCQQNTAKTDKTIANDPPSSTKTDPPVDDLPPDNSPITQLLPKELAAKGEEIRRKLKAAGLKVPDEISWQMRDFKFALEGKRLLHLSDEDFFGALENYATLLDAKQNSLPADWWWDAKMPIGSLFKGTDPPVMRFLPYAFDLNSFRKTNKGKQGGGVKRGIDAFANYDAKVIAEKQAAQQAEQDAMHDDAYYASVNF